MARILVLDDVEDAARLVKRVLEDRGHRVFAFTEAAAALDFIAGEPVDVSIVDLKLKTMDDGISVLKKMRRLAPSVRLMAMTGYPSVENARKVASLGGVAYCTKPMDNEELLSCVERVLSSGPVRCGSSAHSA